MNFRALRARAARLFYNAAAINAFDDKPIAVRSIPARQARDMFVSGFVSLVLAAGTATAALTLGEAGALVRPPVPLLAAGKETPPPAAAISERECARLAERIIVGDDKPLRERRIACGR